MLFSGAFSASMPRVDNVCLRVEHVPANSLVRRKPHECLSFQNIIGREKDEIAEIALRVLLAIGVRFVGVGVAIHADAVRDETRLSGRKIRIKPEPSIERLRMFRRVDHDRQSDRLFP